MSDENLRKVFVGNVVYDCTQEEFENCFKNIPGYVKGELVIGQNDDYCRGFGFVTLETINDLENLKLRNDIFLKGRQLRFTKYIMTDKKNTEDNKTNINNYIFVDGIPNNKKREYLFSIFQKYGEIGKHFICTDIETSNPKNNGMVEIINLINYRNLLLLGSITDDEGNELILSKWRHKINQNGKSPKNELYKAFNAGRNLGIMEGRKIAEFKNN